MEFTVRTLSEEPGLKKRFPESGTYVVAGAFQPVKIDVRRDIGRYEEANVWMRHPIAPHPPLSPLGERGKLVDTLAPERGRGPQFELRRLRRGEG